MVLGAGLEAGMNYGLHDLPERLQEDDPPGVCVPLGDGDQYGPTQLLRDILGAPHVLDYFHELHLPSRFGVFFAPYLR